MKLGLIPAASPAAGERGPAIRRGQARRLELLCLAVFAAVLAAQLLVPPFIGLANNGDFPKVTGRFSLGPTSGWWENFYYFTAEYVRDEKYRWESDILSSELILAGAAVKMAGVFSRAGTFDIRYLGLIHSVLLLIAYGCLLIALRPQPPWVRVLVAGIVLFVFSDVAYVSYFNSFYSDTSALLGLLMTVAAAICLISIRESRPLVMAVMTAGALLLATSKAQHGILAPLVAGIIVLACRRHGPRMRRAGAVSAVAVLAAAALTYAATPNSYRAQALFNLVFHQLPRHSANFSADLEELGVEPGARRFSGMHAYSPGSPAQDPRWLEDFYRSSGYGRLALFYLRHPRRALTILAADLKEHAFRIRPHNLSNFRRVDGHPPGALTRRFALWSDLRANAFLLWPYHVVWWLVAAAAGAAVVLRRSISVVNRDLARICLCVVAMSGLEFGLASLADAAETYRHLLLFHGLTDVSICFGGAFVAAGLAGRPGRNKQAKTPAAKRGSGPEARAIEQEMAPQVTPVLTHSEYSRR
jgi:hypothetical protein